MSESLNRAGFLKKSAATTGLLLAGPSAIANAASSRVNVAGLPGKPAGLNMLYATVEADSAAIQAVVPEFQKAFGFPLNVDYVPYPGIQTKAVAELAAKSSHYDIITHDISWMTSVVDQVEPLSPYINNPKLVSSDLNLPDFIGKVFYDTVVWDAAKSSRHFPDSAAPVNIKNITSKGFDVFALPIQANALTMSYRADMFNDPAQKAAFKAQHKKDLAVPQTWDDFVQVAGFFTDPGKRRWGTTLMAGAGDWSTDDFKTILASFGGDGHLVTDNFALAFDSALGVQALTFYQDMIQKQKITPPGTTSADWNTVATTFGSGLTAMSMNYHTVALNSNVKGKISYAMAPKKVVYGPHFGTWMMSVNKFGNNKPWAFRALTWLTSAASQDQMLSTQLHPTRTSVYAKAAADKSFTQKFGNFYSVLGQSLAAGVGRPRLTNYSDVDTAIWVAVNNAANGADPKTELDKAATQVKSLLKRAGYR